MCSCRLRLYASKVPNGWHMSWELKHKYKSTRWSEGRVFQTNRPAGTKVYWREGSRWVKKKTGETQKGSESGAQKTWDETVQGETELSRAMPRSQEANCSLTPSMDINPQTWSSQGKDCIWVSQGSLVAAWRMNGGGYLEVKWERGNSGGCPGETEGCLG